MLRHMRLYDEAANIEQAVFKTIAEGKNLTADLGGRATNTQYTNAVIQVNWNWIKWVRSILTFSNRTWRSKAIVFHLNSLLKGPHAYILIKR